MTKHLDSRPTRFIQNNVIVFLFLLLTTVFIVSATGRAIVPPDAAPGSTLQQRIDQRKAERNVKLDAKLLLRLKGRCTAVQASVRALHGQLVNVVTSRDKVYQQIDGKLWITIGQLKLGEKDTFELEKQRATFTAKVAGFDSTAAQLKQTLDDIVVMNCEKDLEGFMALVETSRLYHEDIRTESADIKKYVVDTIKISLSDFTSELQTKPATEENK